MLKVPVTLRKIVHGVTVMEKINNVMYGVRLDFGQASAMSWIYFGVALAFIAVCTVIITFGVVRRRE